MNALLLSAGFGKRMRPKTVNFPKCLFKVNNHVLIDMWIEKCLKLNVRKCLINVHHLYQKVEVHVKNNFPAKVITVFEPKLLGTAQTIIKNYEILKNDDCIVIHTDNYCEDDLKKLNFSFINRPKNCLMTMMTFRSKKPETCGIIKTNKSNIMTEFFEKVKNPPGNQANSAVYIFSRELIRDIKDNYPLAKDISKDIIPNFKRKINIYETQKAFFDIGTKNLIVT